MAEIAKLEPRKPKRAKCPICGKPPEPRYRPFCSKHCADIDLGRWLGGRYRIETNETPETAAEPGDKPEEER